MSRPKHCRRVGCQPGTDSFRPCGIPKHLLAEIVLSVDELEALKLADLQDLYQAQAAERMGVSRQTFGRVVGSARHKVAEALVLGKALRIEGGHYREESTGRIEMKIAVAVTKNGSISRHFGQSAEFRVFSFEDGTLTGQESRSNPHRGEHHHHEHHGKQDGAGLQQLGASCAGQEPPHHGHDWVIETLGDCRFVICGGMGGGARAALDQNNIKPYAAGKELSPEEAARLLVEGKLEQGDLSCSDS